MRDSERTVGKENCLGKTLIDIAIGFRQCAQIEVVSGEVRGRLARGALDLGQPQARFDRTGDAGRNLVLQLKNVVERAIEAVGPDVSAGRRVDQLAGDAHPIAGFAHAAFEHVAHTQSSCATCFTSTGLPL